MILQSILILSVASPIFAATSPPVEIALPATASTNDRYESLYHALFDSTLYFGAGAFFGTASLLSSIGWGICQLSPWTSNTANEFLISTELLGIAAIHSFAQGIKGSPFFSPFFNKFPSSHSAWNLNQKMLSQIPADSVEDKDLLQFLQRRWLAKITGCFPFHVDWMFPPFGISFQVHPETTNSYARDPSDKYSDTYKNRLEAWKQCLPHPHQFPLILTRPSNIRDYLPSYVEVLTPESIPADFPIVIDLTSVLPSNTSDPNQWQGAWHAYEKQFSKWCNENKVDLDKVLCIERVQQKEIGGIRLLPLSSVSNEKTEQHFHFLLEWVSRFGLAANRIELDRLHLPSDPSHTEQPVIPVTHMEFEPKEEWNAFLDSMEQGWKSTHPQKTLMFKGTVQVLRDLYDAVPEEKWEEIKLSTTRSSVVQLCTSKIKQQLHQLIQEDETASFHMTVTHIEQVLADLSSLLEIFSPFTTADFLDAFQRHLTTIPQELRALTGYGIHTSAMTSLASIFKASEKTLGRKPRILFGENTYFECIHASEHISKAVSIPDATEEDWKKVDLILAQFNPTVKRINFKVTEYQATEYHVEKIAEFLHTALKMRDGRPLTLALDCTLDFSDSPRVGELLSEFQKEIKQGDLNIVCYRSGLKFDLFGMDNYCGAPLFMLHNQDAKWSHFDALLTDPALHTDPLSVNWFCLVLQNAAPYLEAYRKQIFDNTRAILDQIPPSLYNPKNPSYRVIPIDADADASFLDIKIFGPFHTFRGELLVGVFLTIKCIQAGYPLLYRPGIGFHHPNLAVLFGKECTTVRLTVGLDPGQVDVIVRCLKLLDPCNGTIF